MKLDKNKKNKIVRYNPSKKISKEGLRHKIPTNSLLLKASQALDKNEYSSFCKFISHFTSSVTSILDVDFSILITSMASSEHYHKCMSYIKSLPEFNKFFVPGGKIYDTLFLDEFGPSRMRHMMKPMGETLLNESQIKFFNSFFSTKSFNYIIDENAKTYLLRRRYERIDSAAQSNYEEAIDNKKRNFLSVFSFLDKNYDLGKMAKFKNTLKFNELEQIKLNYLFEHMSLVSDKPKEGGIYPFKATPNLTVEDAKEIFTNLKISPAIAAKNFSKYYDKIKNNEIFLQLYLDKLTEKSLVEDKGISLSIADLTFFLEECVKRHWRIENFKHNLINRGYFSAVNKNEEYQAIICSYSDKQNLEFSISSTPIADIKRNKI